MSNESAMDEKGFRRILNRNVGLPLGLGLVGALFFALLIGYLLNVIRWVEHTDQVLNRASEVYKLTLDLETGMRGFLLSGNEEYLAPYEQARGKYRPLAEQIIGMVGDNPPQVQRIERLLALQEQWDRFAQEIIGIRRDDGDYLAEVARGRGKNLTDGMRRELDTFINSERELRQQRNADVSSTTLWGAGIYLVVSILFSALLALFGRRELMSLSQTYSQAMARQAEYGEEQRRRAWLGGGQTLLSERLLGQPQVQELADRSLEFLAEYLNCVVAALYLRDAHTGDLRRVAGYGFSKDASLKEHFYRGEGLVGRIAQGARQGHAGDIGDGQAQQDLRDPPRPLFARQGVGGEQHRHAQKAAMRQAGQEAHADQRAIARQQRRQQVDQPVGGDQRRQIAPARQPGAEDRGDRRADHDPQRIGADDMARLRVGDAEVRRIPGQQAHGGEFRGADGKGAQAKGKDGQSEIRLGRHASPSGQGESGGMESGYRYQMRPSVA